MFKDKRINSYTRNSQERKTKLLLAKDVLSYRISEKKNSRYKRDKRLCPSIMLTTRRRIWKDA